MFIEAQCVHGTRKLSPFWVFAGRTLKKCNFELGIDFSLSISNRLVTYIPLLIQGEFRFSWGIGGKKNVGQSCIASTWCLFCVCVQVLTK